MTETRTHAPNVIGHMSYQWANWLQDFFFVKKITQNFMLIPVCITLFCVDISLYCKWIP